MFDPNTIIAAINALASLVQEGTKLVQNSKAVISNNDAQAIHAALLRAEEATKISRANVNAALEAAANR